jgi:hypothetical protein
VTKKADTKVPSVALQQRSDGGVTKHAKLTQHQLHQQTLKARETLFKMCDGAEKYAVDVVVPYCEEIIARYKMPGVPAKARPNGKPTVEAYFLSIKLNYNTVRSWIHRKRLSTEMFDPQKANVRDENDKIPITEFEALLVGAVSAGHNLVKALDQGGNVYEAMQEFEEVAPSPSRIEEYIERPVKVVASEVEKMAVRLCKLIDRNDDKHGEKILALARELLTKAEPITVQQVLAEERKRPAGIESGNASASRVA